MWLSGALSKAADDIFSTLYEYLYIECELPRAIRKKPTEKSHHVVFLYELVPPPVVKDFFYILLVTGQRPLFFYSNACWQVVGVLEGAGEVAYFGLELVDRGGFGAGWGVVVGLWTFGGVVGLASRG